MILASPPPHPIARAARQTVFEGSVNAASGRYKGAKADVRIVLKDLGRHRFSATINATECTVVPRCPRGVLRGTWRALPAMPDVGQSAALTRGVGRLAGLGHTRARGTAHGTGYIQQGKPTLRVKLTTSTGTMTIAASGPTEPGFTPVF